MPVSHHLGAYGKASATWGNKGFCLKGKLCYPLKHTIWYLLMPESIAIVFKPALLIYNLYIIKLPLISVQFYEFWQYMSWNLHSNIQNILVTPKSSLVLLCIYSPPWLLAPSNPWSIVCFCFVLFCFFLILYEWTHKVCGLLYLASLT